MKKIIYAILIITILTASTIPAFAWDAEDYYDPSGENILVPMQTPVFTPGAAFTEYTGTDITDPYGKAYGADGHVKVYKGEVATVNRDIIGCLNDYAFVNGTYKISYWYMEAVENPKTNTRITRGGIPNGSSYTWASFEAASNKNYMTFPNGSGTSGVWQYASCEFDVPEGTYNAGFTGIKDFYFTWERKETPASDEHYYLYIADAKIVKYPNSALSVTDTNDGDTISARESAFETEFSVPVDETTVEKVTINGVVCDKANLDISKSGNKLIVKPKNGFLPGSTNTVKIEGVTDIFGRKYETPVAGTVTASNYTNVAYSGESEGNFNFSVTNKMKTAVNFYVAVFYYNGTEIKDIKYSTLQSNVAENQTVPVAVPAISNTENWSKKAWVISTTPGVPMIMARELEI